MYEGPIKAASHADNEEHSILRQLRWTDLVARIAATRDHRTVDTPDSQELHASFSSLSEENADNSNRCVNRDVLSHGKFARLTAQDITTDADTATEKHYD